MKIIERKMYLDRVIGHLNHGMMLVLVGQRRVGKSCLLRSVYDWIKLNKEGSNIVYIDKDIPEHNHINTAEDLYAFASSHLPIGGDNYLLVDEIQNIPKYEDALRGLYAEERCQIIITGSNAYVFSSELSTRLSGRYIEIPVRSLTYREFLMFRNEEDNDTSLMEFLRIGGLPGLTSYSPKDIKQIGDYLQGVYNTIIVRDIIEREDIRNPKFLRNLSMFIADNIGKLFSINNIVKHLNSQGEKVSYEMVNHYLDFITSALIIEQVARYDIHGKRLFDNIGKNYFSDHGMRNLLTGFNIRGSIEKVIENVVYHQLVTQGFDVFVGIIRVGEIDFVAVRNDVKIYIQATYLLGSEETVRREFEPLWSIKDHFPKYVISMDPVVGGLSEYPGINHIHLRQFLTMDL